MLPLTTLYYDYLTIQEKNKKPVTYFKLKIHIHLTKFFLHELKNLLYVQEVVTRPKILNRTILSNWIHVT